MIRLLHLSDVHLNAGFANKNSYIRNKIKEALYETIEKVIDYAIEYDLEGLIVAGDFFDDDKISFRDEHFVMNQFRRLLNKGQKIFYVTGNHDPMLTARFLEPLSQESSFYMFDEDTVKCLDVISRDGEPYKVVGVGHKSKNEQRNLVKNYPIKSTDEVWIGIAHASVPTAVDITDKTRYMATALSQIEKLDYNYFALGHIHIRQLLTPKIGYSGNLQGLNIKETGSKGGYLVTLEPHATKVETVNFNVIQWEQCDFELPTDIHSLSELQLSIVDHVTKSIESNQSAANQIIMRLNLKGRSSLKNQLEVDSNCTYLSEIIKDKTGLLDLEIKFRHLTGDYNLEVLSSENTILSQMIKRISDGKFEATLQQKIFELPIFVDKIELSEKVSYIHSMRDDLIQAVIERMVVQPDEN